MTRPRRDGGEISCRRVLAVVMKRMPHSPSPTRIPMVTNCHRETPMSTSRTEKQVAAPNSSRRVGLPRAAIQNAAIMDPIPSEEVNAPNPAGPESNTYRANKGRTVMKL
ncbi:MAG: hypothetical protein BWY79_02077 [Actinobacteria bacterium ADurb.Bin444]|nr:MAG: hypothetical protein BWY79_02077 [Actinobacteria bacterium ADurb.Bin444]